MKRMFFSLVVSLFSLFTLLAQVDAKYLAGAVPEEDGRVVFREEFQIPGVSKSEIYQRVLPWATSFYNDEVTNSLVYKSEEEGVLSCRGSQELVFQSTALSLDKTTMRYQLNVFCEQAICKVELKSISYIYNVSYKETPEIYRAEEWITDKEAVNKKKLYRNNGKFRIKTIDFVEDLFKGIGNALNASPVAENVTVKEGNTFQAASLTTSVVEEAGKASLSLLKSYKKIEPDKIPGNIIKMLSNDWMLVTAGTDEKFNMMTASWGGLGVLWQKPVAYCFINPSRYTYELMDKGSYYTLSFYTEAYRETLQYTGSASGRDTDKVKESGLTPITMPSGSKSFEEAWLILECKKVLGQQLDVNSVFLEGVKEQWEGKLFHKMFAGEIIGVWVK